MEMVTIPGHLTWLANHLHGMQQQGKLCDVTLATATGPVAAHSAVLAASHATWRSFFLQRSQKDTKHFVLKMMKYSKETIEQLLQFVYKGEVVISQDTAVAMTKVFQEFEFSDAVQTCTKFKAECDKSDLASCKTAADWHGANTSTAEGFQARTELPCASGVNNLNGASHKPAEHIPSEKKVSSQDQEGDICVSIFDVNSIDENVGIPDRRLTRSEGNKVKVTCGSEPPNANSVNENVINPEKSHTNSGQKMSTSGETCTLLSRKERLLMRRKCTPESRQSRQLQECVIKSPQLQGQLEKGTERQDLPQESGPKPCDAQPQNLSVKRGRGRPKKITTDTANNVANASNNSSASESKITQDVNVIKDKSLSEIVKFRHACEKDKLELKTNLKAEGSLLVKGQGQGHRSRVLTKAERKGIPHKIVSTETGESDTEEKNEVDYHENSDTDPDWESPKTGQSVTRAALPGQRKGVRGRRKGGKGKFTHVKRHKVHIHTQCHKCHQRFDSAAEYQTHRQTCTALVTMSRRENITCRKCLGRFAGVQDLTEHRRTCNVKRHRLETKCRKCGERFDTREELRDHKKVHSDVAKRPVYRRKSIVYHCEQCDYTCRSEKLRTSHLHTKHGEPLENGRHKIYTCEASGCDYQTLFQFMMKNHRMIHADFRQWVCEICGKCFKQKCGLESHLKTVHGIGAKSYECPHCDKSLKTSSAMKMHIRRIHEREKDLQCTECVFQAFDLTTLESHRFSKHGVPYPKNRKSYSCTHCRYVTRWKNQYDSHVRRHTGECPYECKECGKKFPAKSDLTAHAKWHYDKKYKCSYEPCKFATTLPGKLQEHVRQMHTHKHEKPFQCHICEYRTNVRGNLILHLRKVHKLTVETKRHRVAQVKSQKSDSLKLEDMEISNESLGLTVVGQGRIGIEGHKGNQGQEKELSHDLNTYRMTENEGDFEREVIERDMNPQTFSPMSLPPQVMIQKQLALHSYNLPPPSPYISQTPMSPPPSLSNHTTPPPNLTSHPHTHQPPPPPSPHPPPSPCIPHSPQIPSSSRVSTTHQIAISTQGPSTSQISPSTLAPSIPHAPPSPTVRSSHYLPPNSKNLYPRVDSSFSPEFSSYLSANSQVQNPTLDGTDQCEVRSFLQDNLSYSAEEVTAHREPGRLTTHDILLRLTPEQLMELTRQSLNPRSSLPDSDNDLPGLRSRLTTSTDCSPKPSYGESDHCHSMVQETNTSVRTLPSATQITNNESLPLMDRSVRLMQRQIESILSRPNISLRESTQQIVNTQPDMSRLTPHVTSPAPLTLTPPLTSTEPLTSQDGPAPAVVTSLATGSYPTPYTASNFTSILTQGLTQQVVSRLSQGSKQSLCHPTISEGQTALEPPASLGQMRPEQTQSNDPQPVQPDIVSRFSGHGSVSQISDRLSSPLQMAMQDQQEMTPLTPQDMTSLTQQEMTSLTPHDMTSLTPQEMARFVMMQNMHDDNNNAAL